MANAGMPISEMTNERGLMTSETETKQTRPKARRAQVGRVVSISGSKTFSVVVENLVKHPMYGKYMRRRTKLSVHDEQSKAKIGDLVEILPSRRLSKTKTHRLLRVLRSAEGENV